LTDRVISQVAFEIDQIDQLFVMYADLLASVRQTTPDLVEMTAVASVLHSFYNGVENIFLSIAKNLDRNVPTGPQWHRDLLVQMTRETAHRGPVISMELALELADYLGFRHFYRHSYSFSLEWTELDQLVVRLPDTWERARREINEFLANIS